MAIMNSRRMVTVFVFLLGFGLGGVSLHIAEAQGLFGIKDSVAQIGTSLVEMQKNVDSLQKNMNTIKKAKDQLSSLPSPSGSGVGGMMDSLMNKGK